MALQRYTTDSDGLAFEDLNTLADNIEWNNIYSFGQGVISGMIVETYDGLVATVTAGVMRGLELYRSYVDVQTDAFPDNATRYLWRSDANGSFQVTSTTAQPATGWVCLAEVTTLSGEITVINNVNRMLPWRTLNLFNYILGDNTLNIDTSTGYKGFGKIPTTDNDFAGNVSVDGDLTIAASLFVVDSVADEISIGCDVEQTVGRLRHGYERKTLSGTETLDGDEPNVLRYKTGGVNRKVLMYASPDWNDWHRIHNDDSAGDLQVRDTGDTTTLYTVTPGTSQTIYPRDVAGVATW